MSYSKEIRLLVVEDDPVQAQVLQDKLLEYNPDYLIVRFKTGEELLAFLEKNYFAHRPYYVILDYFLQNSDQKDALNGAQIIELIEQQYKKIKVILFSAYENDEETKFQTLQEKNVVLSFVRKTEYAYSRLQNLIRFDYSKHILSRKRRRFIIFSIIFTAIVLLSFAYLVITYYIL